MLRCSSYLSVQGYHSPSANICTHVIFLQVGCTEVMITKSALAITDATNFIALLQLLYFGPQTHTCYQNVFILSMLYDGGGSTETFLKTLTLSVSVWAYPHEMKRTHGILRMPPVCLNCYSVIMEVSLFLFPCKFKGFFESY